MTRKSSLPSVLHSTGVGSSKVESFSVFRISFSLLTTIASQMVDVLEETKWLTCWKKGTLDAH